MKLIKPSFEIVPTNGEEVLRRIEAAGRTCYKSEDRVTEDSCKAFVAMIIKHGHETVIEHEKMTVRIICDRGVSHELVRHWIATSSQESTRYCDYTGGHITFIIPPWVRVPEGEHDIVWEQLQGTCWPIHTLYSNGDINTGENSWFWSMALAERDYKRLRSHAWKPEEARSILPNSLKTEIVMTANLREWRHFFKLRTAPTAHPQMREITIPMLAEFKTMIPVIFDDL